MSTAPRRPQLPPDPVLVVGLARSGVAAALALRERGLRVIGSDARAPAAESRAALQAAGVRLEAPGDGLSALADARSLVKSPGVPQEAPVVRAARERGLPVCGELEVAWRLLPNPFLAVTGSNGKTTTVEWIGEMYRCARRAVRVAGNVGTALSSLAGRLEPEETIVCEASSFQLEDSIAFAPEVAVLLNLAPDHLDRHGTFEAYRAAKLRIFANQPPDAVAVLPTGLDVSDAPGRARRVRFGRAPEADLTERDGTLWWRGDALLPTSSIRLPGRHNRDNAMAAAAAALCAGLPREAVCAGLESFSGVSHRLEPVATMGGVAYVNDSKATNVASAVVGVTSFPGGVHLIAGGRGKGERYEELAAAAADRCRAVYLIGETAAEMERAVAAAGVACRRCGDLERALAAARAAAAPGDVVLLSPACASFDQYESFEERGAHFRSLVTGGS